MAFYHRASSLLRRLLPAAALAAPGALDYASLAPAGSDHPNAELHQSPPRLIFCNKTALIAKNEAFAEPMTPCHVANVAVTAALFSPQSQYDWLNTTAIQFQAVLGNAAGTGLTPKFIKTLANKFCKATAGDRSDEATRALIRKLGSQAQGSSTASRGCSVDAFRTAREQLKLTFKTNETITIPREQWADSKANIFAGMVELIVSNAECINYCIFLGSPTDPADMRGWLVDNINSLLCGGVLASMVEVGDVPTVLLPAVSAPMSTTAAPDFATTSATPTASDLPAALEEMPMTMQTTTMPCATMPIPTMPTTPTPTPMMPMPTMPMSTLMPMMALPSTPMQTMTMPTTTMPSTPMPTMTMPTMTMPTMTMPSTPMPTMAMPTTTMPTMTMSPTPVDAAAFMMGAHMMAMAAGAAAASTASNAPAQVCPLPLVRMESS